MSKIKTLICCCCGGYTKGRQWYNRDTGYGLCTQCSGWLQGRETEEEMERNYGKKGIHYDVQ